MTGEKKLSEYISQDHIILELHSKTKSGILKELAEFAVEKGFAPSAVEIYEGLEAREKLISTAVGDGVAIPHTRCEGPTDIFILIARSRQGIDFDSLDGGLTHLFVTIIGPPGADKDQLKVLSRTARFLKRKEFRQGVMAATTSEEIVQVLVDEDQILSAP